MTAMSDNRLKTHYEYHVWANERWFRRLAELPSDVFAAPVTSVFGSVGEAFGHIYTFDQVWCAAIEDRSFEEVAALMPKWHEEAAAAAVDLGEMRALYAAMAERFRSTLERLPDADFARTYRHPVHGPLEATYFEVLTHVVNHGAYHRGNAAAMLRQLGHAGPSTDYIFYLYDRAND